MQRVFHGEGRTTDQDANQDYVPEDAVVDDLVTRDANPFDQKNILSITQACKKKLFLTDLWARR